MRKRLAFPNPVVCIVPKMLERFPPVTRPRMLDVARPELLRKFAMLLLGTLKSPKLWKRLAPPPGLVPPVMSYWTFPEGSVEGGLTRVLSPDERDGGNRLGQGGQASDCQNE